MFNLCQNSEKKLQNIFLFAENPGIVELLTYYVHLSFKIDGLAMFSQNMEDLESLKQAVFQILINGDQNIEEMFLKQDTFSSTKINPHLKSEIQALISNFSEEFLTENLLEIERCNWTNLLPIFSCVIASGKLCEKLEDKLMNFLENDPEKFRKMLLLARQMSLEPSSKFGGSYSKFFEHYFSTQKLSWKKQVHFFQVHSGLVPFENASVLATHLNHQINVPLSLRDVANDYYMLARTRRKDLIAQHSLFEADIHENLSEVDNEIEKVLKTFQNNQEIPQLVHKMSVFNRPYFNNVFVPRLLKLSEKDEDKMELVRKLKEAKKIN